MFALQSLNLSRTVALIVRRTAVTKTAAGPAGAALKLGGGVASQ